MDLSPAIEIGKEGLKNRNDEEVSLCVTCIILPSADEYLRRLALTQGERVFSERTKRYQFLVR